MCGIAGFIGDFIPGLMARMNAAQVHRGPDGQGVFEDSEVRIALGHVRLFILDLTAAAAQPMYSPDGYFSSGQCNLHMGMALSRGNPDERIQI